METQEKNFEESIEKYLVTKGGYHISDGLGYDRLKGYNPKVLIDFIASTQNKKWMKLMSIHGEYTKDYFLKKVEEQIKEHEEGIERYTMFSWAEEVATEQRNLNLARMRLAKCISDRDRELEALNSVKDIKYSKELLSINLVNIL